MIVLPYRIFNRAALDTLKVPPETYERIDLPRAED
jgi:hypothetical protein